MATKNKLHFDVSTGLKRVLGRELITDDEVAIFELVKNSFDAGADSVQLYFGEDEIVIADNGSGMSYEDLTAQDVLWDVIWGSGRVEQRIRRAVRDDHWSIPGLGFSALGETVGWAKPSEYPPRNDRTLKALRALGYPVKF